MTLLVQQVAAAGPFVTQDGRSMSNMARPKRAYNIVLYSQCRRLSPSLPLAIFHGVFSREQLEQNENIE